MVRRMRAVNNYSSTLSSGVTSGATSWTVASATGLPTEGDFYLVCNDEIVLCTHRTGTTLTVIRAQADTTASAHSASDSVKCICTADELYARANEAGVRKCLPFGRCQEGNGRLRPASDFFIRNSGSSTGINDGADGILRFQTKTHDSVSMSGATVTLGTANDWRITTHMTSPAVEGSGIAAPTPDFYGLGARQSDGTLKLIVHRPGSPAATGPNWGKVRVQSNTSFTSGRTTQYEEDYWGRRDCWFRLEIEWNISGSDDALRWYWSADGVHWVLAHTHTFATSSDQQVGIWAHNDGGPGLKRFIINSWLDEAVTF